ncbi:hypothetical protein VDGL01_01877 [Verticillium dahliae]
MRSAKTLDLLLTVVMHTSLFVVRPPFHHPSPQIFFSGLFRDRTQAPPNSQPPRCCRR